MEYFIKGFLVGFCVAAPIGPMAIFCIRQTMTYGLISGLAAGLGISLADSFYSGIAALSSNMINAWLKMYDTYFYMLGGGFLVFLGIKVFTSPIIQKGAPRKNRKAIRSFLSTLFLTLASPMTTLLFIGMFATYGVFDRTLIQWEITQLIIGVGMGAMSWWIILTSFVHFMHTRYDIVIFRYINRISGFGILGFGLYTVLKTLKSLLF